MSEPIPVVVPPALLPVSMPGDFTTSMTPDQHLARWREWDVYLRRLASYNDAGLRAAQAMASQALSIAQGATAAQLKRAADAQEALNVTMSQPAPARDPTDDELTLRFTEILASNGVGTGAPKVAIDYVKALRAATQPIYQVPA